MTSSLHQLPRLRPRARHATSQCIASCVQVSTSARPQRPFKQTQSIGTAPAFALNNGSTARAAGERPFCSSTGALLAANLVLAPLHHHSALQLLWLCGAPGLLCAVWSGELTLRIWGASGRCGCDLPTPQLSCSTPFISLLLVRWTSTGQMRRRRGWYPPCEMRKCWWSSALRSRGSIPACAALCIATLSR